MLGVLTSPYVQSETRIDPEADASGWRRASIPVGSERQACVSLLPFGVELEVLEPPELRVKMAELAAGLSALYASTDEAADAPAG
jgi:predicted DNA-binding transcriptional regulator YafY